MNGRIWTLLLLTVLLINIALLWGPAVAQEKPAAAAVKWEYKVIVLEAHDLQAMSVVLNKAGEERWELTGTVSEVLGGNGPQPNRTRAHLLLKRPK